MLQRNLALTEWNYTHITRIRIKHITLHFTQKKDSIQYNAALAIMRAIRGTSKGKLYCELGLEPFEKEDGAGNCVTFLRFSDKNAQSTY